MGDLETQLRKGALAWAAILHLANEWPLGTRVYQQRDGFKGDVIGFYNTREGRAGLVVQQDDTKIVHVYHTQWLEVLPND